jgi:hypothetical protein
MSTVVPEPEKRPLESVAVPQGSDRPATCDDNEEPVIIHVGAVAFLRTMWSLFWTAFRHPLTTTYVDVATGEVVPGPDEEI